MQHIIIFWKSPKSSTCYHFHIYGLAHTFIPEDEACEHGDSPDCSCSTTIWQLLDGLNINILDLWASYILLKIIIFFYTINDKTHWKLVTFLTASVVLVSARSPEYIMLAFNISAPTETSKVDMCSKHSHHTVCLLAYFHLRRQRGRWWHYYKYYNCAAKRLTAVCSQCHFSEEVQLSLSVIVVTKTVFFMPNHDVFLTLTKSYWCQNLTRAQCCDKGEK